MVITIIGILSGIALVSLSKARDKAYTARGLSFSSSLKGALGNAIVGWWSFDDGVGSPTARDSWGHNDGTLNGSPTWDDGIIMGALSFDPVTNDYVDVPHKTSLDINQAVTIEAWVKIRSFPTTWIRIAVKDAGCASRNYGFWVHDTNRLHFSLTKAGACNGSYSDGTVFNDKWHHVTVTYDNADGNAMYYIDGQLDSIKNHGADIGEGINTNRLEIGTNFDGLIDEVVIYSRAIPTVEIQKHYVEGLERHKNFVLQKP